MLSESVIRPADDFGEYVVATGEVLVRRLVRNTKAPSDLSQAEFFEALLLNDFQCLADAGFAKVFVFRSWQVAAAKTDTGELSAP